MATETLETIKPAGEAPANGSKASHKVPEPPLTDKIIERVIERIGGRAGVETAYGEPIVRGELTVVPVARVRWAFGAGSGMPVDEQKPNAAQCGAGAGGGVMVDPIGYLEIGARGSEFKPIVPPYPGPLFLLAAGVTAALVLRGIAKLLGR